MPLKFNIRRFKGILFILFVFIISFTLSSCNLLLFDFSDKTVDNRGKSYDEILNYTFDDNIKNEVSNIEAEMDRIYAQGVDVYSYISNFNALYKLFTEILEYRTKAYIIYCLDKTNDNNEKYLNILEYLQGLRKYILQAFKDAYNSDFRSSFFRGWTQEEIDNVLKLNYTDKYYELQKQQDELIQRYELLSLDEKIEQAKIEFPKLINLSNEMSKELNYNNYIEMAYDEIYDRDYSYYDSSLIYNYAKKYFKDLLIRLSANLKAELSLLNSYQRKAINDFVKNYKYDDSEQYFKHFAENLSGKYLDTYNHLNKTNLMFLGSNDNSLDGAFTTYGFNSNEPYLYFGKNYQSPFTIIHEFGHYFSYYLSSGSSGSYDLSETQSQSGEILFLYYLKKENIIDSNLVRALTLYKLVDDLQSVLTCLAVNEFELRCYQLDSFDNVDFDEIYLNIIDDLIGLDYYRDNINQVPETYWKRVCISNAFYYISYSSSLIPSLGTYVIASNDYDDAKTKYFNLCSKSEGFKSVLEEVGYLSPFEESSYQQIVNSFTQI